MNAAWILGGCVHAQATLHIYKVMLGRNNKISCASVLAVVEMVDDVVMAILN